MTVLNHIGGIKDVEELRINSRFGQLLYAKECECVLLLKVDIV